MIVRDMERAFLRSERVVPPGELDPAPGGGDTGPGLVGDTADEFVP